ncbi:hypothetical protein Nmel_010093, partial [Mimus melanotis]
LWAHVHLTCEFLARGHQEQCIKSCRLEGNETCSHIIGKCPITQDVRIKRHNGICDPLTKEAQKENWTVFHQRYNGTSVQAGDHFCQRRPSTCSGQKVAEEKVEKYRHLQSEIKDLNNATNISFVGFPIGVMP